MINDATNRHTIGFTTSAESSFGSLGDYTVVSEQGAGHVAARTKASPAKANPAVERAVFAHIKAMRTLGYTRLNTAEVASALSLPRAAVDQAVLRLKSKGVKVAGR